MTDRERDDRPDTPGERQEHAHQGMADLGYGYGSGDYGFRSSPAPDGQSAGDRDTTAPGHGSRDPRADDTTAASDLEAAVQRALRDHPGINAPDLDVKVERGEAYLYGHVQSREQRRLAAEVAMNVPGIADVYNSLRVNETGAESDADSSTGHEARTDDDSPDREDQ